MPRFYGKFVKIVPNNKWSDLLEKRLNVLIRGAARAWLREIILHVPIWTGMARGSIKFARGQGGFLSAYLNVAVPISGVRPFPRFYYHPGRKTRIPKVPISGAKFAKYSFAVTNKVFRFTFRSDVVHFILNEFYGSDSTGAPWHALEKAQAAFQQYIKDNFRDVVGKQVGSFASYVSVPFGT